MANCLAAKVKEARMWTNQKDTLTATAEKRRNDRYLPEVRQSPKIQATDDIAKAVEGCTLTVWALPMQYLRSRVKQSRPFLTGEMSAANLGKGIEEKTWARPSEILMKEFGKFQTVGSLMGPNITKEVAQGFFAEATLALSKFCNVDRREKVLVSHD